VWCNNATIAVPSIYKSTTVNMVCSKFEKNGANEMRKGTSSRRAWQFIRLVDLTSTTMDVCSYVIAKGWFYQRDASALLYRARPVPGDRLGRWGLSQHAESNPGPRVHPARGPRAPNHPVALRCTHQMPPPRPAKARVDVRWVRTFLWPTCL